VTGNQQADTANGDPNDSGEYVWIEVIYESPTGPQTGWVARYYYGGNFNGRTYSAQDLVVSSWDCPGDPPTTPTPFTPSPTTAITPTIYPTTTPGVPPTPPPFALCTNKAVWIQDLCLDWWNYLDNSERSNFLNAQASSLVNPSDFDSLDQWSLANLRPPRGVIDVPSVVWAAQSQAQCNGNPTCLSIVQDSVYLFENMTRIGVDLPDTGDGQVSILGTPLPITFWPSTDTNVQFWGRQSSGAQGEYACGVNRFPSSVPLGFDLLADVCWVCQDLPTVLYYRTGYDLQGQMEIRYPVGSQFRTNYQVTNAWSRNVVSVGQFLIDEGSGIQDGNAMPYRIGEMIFLRTGRNAAQPGLLTHVGLIVKGYNGVVTGAEDFEQVLDEVLVAQIAYSSTGFFESTYNPGITLPLTSAPFIGRFEVITLRTYLYKHLSNPNYSFAINDASGTPVPVTVPITASLSYMDAATYFLAKGVPNGVQLP
jgi:hypothetical protein